MAQLQELTLEQAKAQSGNFMYVFASKSYLKTLPRKYREIIRLKKANESYLLGLSVIKFENGYTEEKLARWKEEIAKAFYNDYAMKPEEALNVLAAGGQVAGKDWEKGVYGIGATKTNTFNGANINGNPVTVDPDTGHIMCGGQDLTNMDYTVFEEVKGAATATVFMTAAEGSDQQFSSYYDKKTGKYYAGTYTMDGQKYKANGKKATNADAASVFENINFAFENIWEMIKKLLKALGVTINEETGEPITAENTFPSQTGDGYHTEESGLGVAGIALVALAGGALLFGGLKPKKSKKMSK